MIDDAAEDRFRPCCPPCDLALAVTLLSPDRIAAE